MKPTQERRARRENTAQELSEALLWHGLGFTPERAPTPLRQLSTGICRDLVKAGWDAQDLINAAVYGMRSLWPFNLDDHRPFTPTDFRHRVVEAVAAGRSLSAAQHRGQLALATQRQRMEAQHVEG